MTETVVNRTLPEVRLTFGGMVGWPLEDLAGVVMVHLERQTGVVDPIVSVDPRVGDLSVSFELQGATGDAAEDVRRAMALFSDALNEASDDESAELSAVDMRAEALTHPRHVEYAKAG